GGVGFLHATFAVLAPQTIHIANGQNLNFSIANQST
ncbi:unnamed protein product, partial [marine sediment metagenome]